MISRAVLVKVAVFAVITVLGIGYVLVHYVGVAQGLLGRNYTVYVDMADSGGIFTTASVTYRGVEIGRVGSIALRPGGIRVALSIQSSRRIPADTRAVVGDGSAIGEQYVDLQPQASSGPYLHQGSVIPQRMTELPVSNETLLVNLDRLVNSVPKQDLSTVVDELGTAFSQTGPDLQRLIDSSHDLLVSASANLPQTSRLIGDSTTVLDTQNAIGNDIVDFARHLASFTGQLRASDRALRTVLTQGVPASTQLVDLENSVSATLPILLGNLVSVSQVTAVRIPALRQVLIIYPYVVATSFGLFPGNGTTSFGIPVPPGFDAQPCKQGYIPASQRRLPSDLSYPPVRWDSFCKAPVFSPNNVDVRGAREAPEPDGRRLGDEPGYMSNAGLPTTNGPTTAGGAQQFQGPDARTYLLASTGGQQRLLGDRSWMWLILGPMG